MKWGFPFLLPSVNAFTIGLCSEIPFCSFLPCSAHLIVPFFCSGSCLDFILHQVEGRILQFYSGSSLVAWQNALRNTSFISVRVKRQSPHFPGECFQGVGCSAGWMPQISLLESAALKIPNVQSLKQSHDCGFWLLVRGIQAHSLLGLSSTASCSACGTP